MSEPLDLRLTIQPAHADAVHLDEVTTSLRDELLDFVEAAERVTARAPSNTKGDLVTLGALAIAVLPAVLPKLVEFLARWCNRDASRSIHISIDNVELKISGRPESLEDALLAVQKLLALPSTASRKSPHGSLSRH